VATQQELADVVTKVEALERTVRALGAGSVASAVACTAGRPHQGRLTFLRGPNEYQCEVDGKVYVKDGAGGLKDR